MSDSPASRRHLRVLRWLAALDAALLAAAVVLALDGHFDVVLVLVPSHVVLFGLLVATATQAVRRQLWEWGFVVQVLSLGPAALLPSLERHYRRSRP
jgi:hypothetical protein